MFRILFGKKFLTIVAILAVTLAAISYTAESRQHVTFVEGAFRELIAPVQRVTMNLSGNVYNFFSNLTRYYTLLDTRDELEAEIRRLKGRVSELEDMQYQNIRLREALEYKEANKEQYELEIVNVIARDRQQWYNTLTIDKGSEDGLEVGMAVVNHQGLIGQITNLSSSTANVLLITDSASALGAMIKINRSPGVIEGMGRESGFLRLMYLPKDALVLRNQEVITSGLGGVFPKGLPIGRIEKVEVDMNGLNQYALVRPYADFERLEEIFVVVGLNDPSLAPEGRTGGE